MLILKHITIQDSKKHTLIEDLNYSLGNDDKVGIIGEDGNGKSGDAQMRISLLIHIVFSDNIRHSDAQSNSEYRRGIGCNPCRSVLVYYNYTFFFRCIHVRSPFSIVARKYMLSVFPGAAESAYSGT